MKILVTGATGFVGEAVCRRLSESKHFVRAISRNPASPYQKGDSIEWVQIPNIDGETDWSDAKLNDIDIIIHLASRVHVIQEHESDPKAAFMRTNCDGAKRLAEKAIAAGVKRFIYISSASVHGNISSEFAFNEASPATPHSDYAESKWQAELALHKLFSEKAISSELIIVRPPLVYGPKVKANFRKLLWLVHKQIPTPLKNINNLRSFVFVDNLVAFLVLCIEKEKLGNQVFLVTDGSDLSTRDLIIKLAKSMNKKCLFFPFKSKWLHAVSKSFGKEKIFYSLCGNLQIDSSHAKKTLNWKPPFTQDEALKLTVDDYLNSLSQESEL